jgi:thiol-disulfide isomerase/thioredoxin
MRVYKKNAGWLILMIGLFCSSFIVSISIKEYSSRLQQDYDVLFENNDGEDINLSNLKGKVVVINYWAKWCMPCLTEMPGLNQLYLDMRENRNIVFMAIDMDGNAVKGAHFMKKRKYSIPVYHIKTELPVDLQTKSIPTTIILDRKGLLVNKHVGGMNFKSTKFKEALQQLSEE